MPCGLGALGVGGGLLGGGPMVRQEVVELVGGVVADAGDDVFEVGENIEVMAFGGLGDRKNDRCGSAPIIASEEEPVFSAQGKGAHPLFGDIIINRKITVLGINH